MASSSPVVDRDRFCLDLSRTLPRSRITDCSEEGQEDLGTFLGEPSAVSEKEARETFSQALSGAQAAQDDGELALALWELAHAEARQGVVLGLGLCPARRWCRRPSAPMRVIERH